MDKLASLFQAHFGCTPTRITPFTGAGSNRRYIRLETDEQSAIGVIGTSIQENRAFIYISRHFAALNLPVPKVYAIATDGMRYLQEDLGSRALYDALAPARARGFSYEKDDENLLEKTLRALAHIQIEGGKGLDETRLLSPRKMDTRAAMFDLNYFKYMFLRVQDIPFDELLLEDDMMQLAKTLCGEVCNTFLYRDFQARNVMLTTTGEPRFIDYQGGRFGPLEYDVASFLWQTSSRYPEVLKERLLEAYLDELSTLRPIDKDRFRERLKNFVLLRTLQVLGAYGLRGIVERKTYFLNSIPTAIDNLQELLTQGVCRSYPYLEETLQRLCEAEINYGTNE